MIEISRRNFLTSTASLAATAPTLGLGVGRMGAMAANTGGYRALVCMMLFGGMDCHDTLLPTDQASYDEYAGVRGPLLNAYQGAQGGNTRARNALLPLNPDNQADFGGRSFGLPSSLQPIHALFEDGKAAIVANVGPLVEPIDRTSYDERTAARPARLYSHNDQQSTWLANAPEGARLGWGGLYADVMLQAGANISPTFTAVSVSGNSVFLSGEITRQFQASSNGSSQLREVSASRLFGSEVVPSMLSSHFRNVGGGHSNVFQQDLASVAERSISANAVLADVIDADPPFTTPFPNSRIGGQLMMVARMIAERAVFGASRQLFFVSAGGYDTHANQVNRLPSLQIEISQAIAAFQAAMEEINDSQNVTLFTTSDFGRTLRVNGDGTDHGWGAHHFVVGGAVDGKRIIGDVPPYTEGHPRDSGRGRLIPAASVEQYAATLGRWFGLNDSELIQATPNLANFAQGDLGFF